MAAENKGKQKINRKRSFSFLLLSTLLFQAVVIVLYLAFVFFSDDGIFKSSKNKIENQLSLYVNSIFGSIDNYSERIKNITDTYSFQDFIYESLLDGINNEELNTISSMFRNTHLPFSSVTIYLVDGQILASVPTTLDREVQSNAFKSAQYATPKAVRATYKESYGGIQFATAVTNNQGTIIGFISANVDKDIFKTSVPGSSVLLLENGVVYFDDTMDLKEISRTILVSLLDRTIINQIDGHKVDNSNYMFYSIGLKRASGLNVGLLVYNDTILQKYSKYIILSIFSIFFIFLVVSFIYDHIKRKNAILESISVDNDKLFDESKFKDDGEESSYPKQDNNIEELENDYEKNNEFINTNDSEDVNNFSSDMDKFSDDIKDLFTDDTKYNYKRKKLYANPKETILTSEEDEYFSSKDSFGFSKNADFLLENVVAKKNIFDNDVEKSVDDILKMASKYSEEESEGKPYEPDNVPTIPDEYFSGGFKSILEATKGVRFIERDMDYILKWVKLKIGIDVDSAIFLEKDAGDIYKTIAYKDISENTKNLFTIKESEAIFLKFLKSKKVIYIDNPNLSKSLSKKFDNNDIKNIDAMIFIPVENRNKELKSFFIALSRKGVI